MKRTRRDEEDKIRLYRAIFRVYRAALHDGEDIPLHALAGNIWARTMLRACDLVNFVDKDDARRPA